MKEIEIGLVNGYSVSAYTSDLADEIPCIYIIARDPSGCMCQDIARVIPEDSGETFRVEVYGDKDSDEPTDDISVELWKEEESEDDGTDDDEDDDTEEISDEDDEEEDPDILEYGAHGEKVKDLQRRLKTLGYFNGDIGGNYLARTKSAVERFQLDAGLQSDGICDMDTWERVFASSAPRVESAQSTAGETRGTAKKMDWWKSDIQKIFAKGVTATITDVDTGLTWKEQRRGGTNHADVQPLTKADTAALKKAYSGKWSWNRRAIWVTIGGVNYAASMNGMPHGGSSIKDNGFDGHHCIHFTNSRTHCSDKVCPNHQKMIEKAAKVKM